MGAENLRGSGLGIGHWKASVRDCRNDWYCTTSRNTRRRAGVVVGTLQQAAALIGRVGRQRHRQERGHHGRQLAAVLCGEQLEDGVGQRRAPRPRQLAQQGGPAPWAERAAADVPQERVLLFGCRQAGQQPRVGADARAARAPIRRRRGVRRWRRWRRSRGVRRQALPVLPPGSRPATAVQTSSGAPRMIGVQPAQPVGFAGAGGRGDPVAQGCGVRVGRQVDLELFAQQPFDAQQGRQPGGHAAGAGARGEPVKQVGGDVPHALCFVVQRLLQQVFVVGVEVGRRTTARWAARSRALRASQCACSRSRAAAGSLRRSRSSSAVASAIVSSAQSFGRGLRSGSLRTGSDSSVPGTLLPEVLEPAAPGSDGRMQLLRHGRLVSSARASRAGSRAVRNPPSGRGRELQPVSDQLRPQLRANRRLVQQQVQQPGGLAGGLRGIVRRRRIRQCWRRPPCRGGGPRG